jgi:hypothetical protein
MPANNLSAERAEQASVLSRLPPYHRRLDGLAVTFLLASGSGAANDAGALRKCCSYSPMRAWAEYAWKSAGSD